MGETLGQNIREAREEIGLNKVQFGKRVGISSSYVDKIERDLSTPSAIVMAKIAKVCGKKFEDFLDQVETEEDVMQRQIQEFAKTRGKIEFDVDDLLGEDFEFKNKMLNFLQRKKTEDRLKVNWTSFRDYFELFVKEYASDEEELIESLLDIVKETPETFSEKVELKLQDQISLPKKRLLAVDFISILLDALPNVEAFDDPKQVATYISGSIERKNVPRKFVKQVRSFCSEILS